MLYTSNAGIEPLREAVARDVSARFGQPIPAERVVITAGAVAAIHVASPLGLDPDDEILIPDPCWPYYLGMYALLGALVVRYPQHVAHGLLPRVENLEALVTPKTRASPQHTIQSQGYEGWHATKGAGVAIADGLGRMACSLEFGLSELRNAVAVTERVHKEGPKP